MDQDIEASKVPGLVDHFFRHESGKIISHLTKKFGGSYLETAEDAVQNSLVKAMQIWPYSGIPDNPSGWILQVARNNMIDILRKEKKRSEKIDAIIRIYSNEETQKKIMMNEEFSDDLLSMMFACCHPSIPRESQIILTLKILCGFGNKEISLALLKKEETIAKAYTRAKKKFAESNHKLEVPGKSEIAKRLNTVLKILYLLFNEGYKSSIGSSLIRKDLCAEAIRLNSVLLQNNLNLPKAHALMALMCFQASRFKSRLGSDSKMLTLEQQDRSLWDKELINKGIIHLEKAALSEKMSDYLLQASIAYFHCTASDYDSTDWEKILELYNLHVKIYPSPIASLNRIVAFSKVNGPSKAIKELNKSTLETDLHDYYLYHAVAGDLYYHVKDFKNAEIHISKAVKLTMNDLEKMHLKRKLERIKSR